jgi:hypothetical protein
MEMNMKPTDEVLKRDYEIVKLSLSAMTKKCSR